VTRQIEGGTAFISSKGWTLHTEHVYSDDGVSGALFANRPAFQRMMRDGEAGAFEAVVFFDIDRFGRDARHTSEALHKLADFGIAIWDYSKGRPMDLNSFEGRLMMNLGAEFSQEYRDNVRKHTHHIRHGLEWDSRSHFVGDRGAPTTEVLPETAL
jgi:DNA invertase Pin-like site-specific DNA recombinase